MSFSKGRTLPLCAPISGIGYLTETCTIFLAGDPAVGYAACSLQFREASIFSPAIRRLMVDHIAVAPEARRQGHGRPCWVQHANWRG